MINLLRKYREIILYIFFGGLTTIVSFVTYYIGTKQIGMHYLAATFFSWLLSVLFAYVTNRIWVFKSKRRSFMGIAKELSMFIAGRLMSGVIEVLLMFVLVDIASVMDLAAKIVCNIIIVILNYIFSKLIIFKQPK